MTDFGDMMKQAQEMQAKLKAIQEKLATVEVGGTSGGGMVNVTLNGKGEMRGLHIDPSLVSGREVGMIEDLVVAAFNDARAKLEVRVADEMAKGTGGLNLPPGLGLGF